jgi:hypothetical protein
LAHWPSGSLCQARNAENVFPADLGLEERKWKKEKATKKKANKWELANWPKSKKGIKGA